MSLLAVPAESSSDDPNLFHSQTLGFRITKLPTWHFMTAEQHWENIQRIDPENEEFQTLVARYSTAPLVVIAKHQEPFDDLNPTLKVNARLTGPLEEGKTGSEILETIERSLARLFQDFQVLHPPIEVEVGGLAAGYMSMNYSLAIPDGRTFPTRSELWVIPRGSYFWILGAGTRQDEATGTRSEIRRMLKSISFQDPE